MLALGHTATPSQRLRWESQHEELLGSRCLARLQKWGAAKDQVSVSPFPGAGEAAKRFQFGDAQPSKLVGAFPHLKGVAFRARHASAGVFA